MKEQVKYCIIKERPVITSHIQLRSHVTGETTLLPFTILVNDINNVFLFNVFFFATNQDIHTIGSNFQTCALYYHNECIFVH